MCAQEEGRLENVNGGGELVFQVQHQKKKKTPKELPELQEALPAKQELA